MNNKGYRLIGLTGPTGSGKSTVSAIMSLQGFAAVDADELSHEALRDEQCKRELTESFGKGILSEDGEIVRKKLAGLAFADRQSTDTLNRITHKYISELANRRFEKLSALGADRIVFDAPTLFESGTDAMCDLVIAVIADERSRCQRIKSRDALTDSQARLRVSAQQPDVFYTSRADFVIVNDGDADSLEAQTLGLIKELRI